ncbi:MAG: excinuclease ABC subunit UvrA [Thermacetogeniaceae bacterium]|jgi:excinuclease ABC subunit A|nr:excinuclease ABC subunit UvrA [Thermoanaerobacterales bacterium]NLN20572.1 excinuclease ABC subunit UvrA [Syntrophomonadaceae bacterium]HAF17823.1 excinuclease ABC subunit UvrA [Peptococcaceae bacterium]
MRDKIVIKGARVHNLKNIDVEIPRNKLVVITGISGSGKSSLAFDTIYAEGQRRYVESLSAYARQFLGVAEKPDVDYIEGLSPAISIDQRAGSRNPRSTVGTVTEIYDYLRLLFARIGRPHCPECGRPVQQQTVSQMVDHVLSYPEGTKIQILAPVIRGKKGEHQRILQDLQKKGFVRVRVNGEIRELDEDITLERYKKHDIDVVVDRVVVRPGLENRLADSLETALGLGEGIAVAAPLEGKEVVFSQNFACPQCGISLVEITPRLFSFNSPYGACTECSGLGYRMEVDPELVVDRERSVREGALLPWTHSTQHYYPQIVKSFMDHYGCGWDIPYKDLPEEVQEKLLYGTDERIRFHYEDAFGQTRSWYGTFEGVVNHLMRRYRETESEDIREEIEQFMTSRPCPGCEGARLRPESLAITVGGKNIAELTRYTILEARSFINNLSLTEREKQIARQVIKEIDARLGFLVNVGLDYLTLDRSAGTLAGGEAQRIRLATQIGSGLVGVLYILDEPSIGLHPRDNTRLIKTLKDLRDLGNTLIVVEHDDEMMLNADEIIDIGPGAGVHGGKVVAQGTLEDLVKVEESITGQYLSGRREIPVPEGRREPGERWLQVIGANEFNLKNIDVDIPLGLFVCITGVSGSGKSTLLDEIIYKGLAQKLHRARAHPGDFQEMHGIEHLDKVIKIDQSPIGRTPRSNPATYTGAFDGIRELFSLTPEARMRGYRPGRFSFNVRGGRCEACRGDGIIKIEMHFLPDVYVPCEECRGKRYNRETLEVKYKGKNIAEVLDMTVSEANEFFQNIPKVKRKLQTLVDVGLGYIRLGQPATTLSGGEAQRVKLATELSRRSNGRTLYILDEPTTGLHKDDIRKLLLVLERLVESGNTVVVIEHNLDVIKTADYIIDLGPEGGDRGGQVVTTGTPEEVADCPYSYTGRYLKEVLQVSCPTRRRADKTSLASG